MRADLHAHTNVSDGDYTPQQLIKLAQDRQLDVLALTDHDALSGYTAAHEAVQDSRLMLIPGVEISTGGVQEYHILGYGDTQNNMVLEQHLAKMRHDRRERIEEIYRRLHDIHIDLDPFPAAESEKSVGRMHIGWQIVRQGYCDNVDEACERYLSRGCHAFVPHPQRSVSDMLLMMRQARLLPVLAHPYLYDLTNEQLQALVPEWMACGLCGIEVYHPSASTKGYAMLEQLCRHSSLLITGGSDFHGHGGHHADLGGMCSDWRNAPTDVARFLRALSEQTGWQPSSDTAQ